MIEPGNFLAGTSLFNDKIINASANEMWKFMSDEVKDSLMTSHRATGNARTGLGPSPKAGPKYGPRGK